MLDADRFANVNLRYSFAHLDLGPAGVVPTPDDYGFILPYFPCPDGSDRHMREEGLLVVDLIGQRIVAFHAENERRYERGRMHQSQCQFMLHRSIEYSYA